MQLFPQFFIAFSLVPRSLLAKSFIIYDIYSPKRDSKRLTWHYSLSLLYTKERRESEEERERERVREKESNAGFYLRQIFNLNFFAVLKKIFLLFKREYAK